MNGNSGRIKTVRTKPRKPWSVEQAELTQKREQKKAIKRKQREVKRGSDGESLDS